MKLERINENQIKCTLSNTDLLARNINLNELAYGTEKINILFNELIQKAVQELNFTVRGPFRIEAVPFPGDNMVVIITNVDDSEEVDVRFTKFSPLENEVNVSMNIDDFEAEGYTDNLMFAKHSFSDNDPGDLCNRIFGFDSLDDVQEAAKAVASTFNGVSRLYKDPVSGIYTLLLTDEGNDHIGFAASCNKLTEYGRKISSNYSSVSYMDEHYDIIIKDSAIQALIKF